MAVAFLCVLVLMPVAIRLAGQQGFVDRPGGRKKHDRPVPPIGGLVVFPVFLGVMWLLPAAPVQPQFGFFALAVLALLVTGAFDDRYSIMPWIKFMMQFVAAFLIVVPGGAVIDSLGNLGGFGALDLRWGAVPFSIIATVLLINAVNLLDGLDGLAGGIGVIALSLIFAGGMVSGMSPDFMASLLALWGALAAFLVFNARYPRHGKASVFLGDSGSMALGLALAWLAIHGAGKEPAMFSPIVVAWILALPIMDTCGQFARRISQKKHPFSADDGHFHHHFLYAGFSDAGAVCIIWAVVLCTGLAGLGAYWAGVPDFIMAYVWTGLLFLHIYLSMRLNRFRRLVSRLRRGAGSDPK